MECEVVVVVVVVVVRVKRNVMALVMMCSVHAEFATDRDKSRTVKSSKRRRSIRRRSAEEK